MKEFFKYTLATICGIILLSIVGGIIFMISLVGIVASGNKTTTAPENSVFVLKLNGAVQERANEDDPFSILMGEIDMDVMGLDDIVASIRKAKDEENIKGIYIEGGISSFDAPATAQQIRDALKDFKKSGKWIVAYSDQYMQASYYVASVADKVFLNRTGMLDFKGLGGKGEYMKGLYDKLGIKYQVAKVGKYKSYVERSTMTGMSDYDREQREAYTQGIWQHWLSDIAESRKVTAEQLNQLANDSIIGLADANDYVTAKLVDKLMYPDEVSKEIKALLKIDADKEISQLTLADMINLPKKDKDKGEKIAVYYAYGSIVDTEATGLFSSDHDIVGKTTVEDLNKLAKDDDVKAVVLRVNSGGGSANASEQIWHAIKQLKTKKPVVVSMGGAAASGGYMISAAADYIFAEPTTITGSIGIFGMIPNFSGLVTDKLGVTFDGVKTNKYTDYEENLVLGKENSAEMRYMQSYVDRGYINFLDIVADGRKMKRDAVDSIAQGRVWLAKDALKIKLVDKLGSLDDAVKKAAELAKVKEYHMAAYPAPASWFDQLLSSSDKKGSYLDNELRQTLGELYQPLLELRRDMQCSRLQAKFPYQLEVK
jgi:protease-4